MRLVRTIAELETASGTGLVPTMGALHDGHVALLRAARHENRRVVMSLFVNPVQFDEPRDLDAYPRDEARDLEIAESEGVDVVFAPAAESRRLREDRARPSVSRTVDTARISTGTFRSRTRRRITASCCPSFWPKYARWGRTRLNSFKQTVATPRKCPGRAAPSAPVSPGSTQLAKPGG